MLRVVKPSDRLEQRSFLDAIYSGQLLVFPGFSTLQEFHRLVEEFIRGFLETEEPWRLQYQLSEEEFRDKVASLQKAFRQAKHVRETLFEAFGDIGLSLEKTFWDKFHLRVSPFGSGHNFRETARLGLHRDTWASNIYQQVNWWMPIYPITEERTIVFAPSYWGRAIENDSHKWDLQELRKGNPDIPIIPRPMEPIHEPNELRVVIAPAELLAFSGAHLHGSTPNTTDRTRFNFETRTVFIQDVLMGKSAPNLDGRAPYIPYEWFKSALDGRTLKDALG